MIITKPTNHTIYPNYKRTSKLSARGKAMQADEGVNQGRKKAVEPERQDGMTGINSGPRLTAEEILASRENRAEKLRELAQEFPDMTLISFKLNIPGDIKTSAAIERFFRRGMEQLLKELEKRTSLLHSETAFLQTGPEAVFVVDYPPAVIKLDMVALEDRDEAGRLYDIDVIHDYQAISRTDLGFAPRRCFLCNEDARVCSRAGHHNLTEILHKVKELLTLPSHKPDAGLL